jgi:hypothetical protein
VLDGTLAADHHVVILTGIDYLDPNVLKALEEFAASGRRVLLTADCTVSIKGATALDVLPRMPDQEKIDELAKAGKYNELGPYTTVAKYIDGAMPLAKAIKKEVHDLAWGVATDPEAPRMYYPTLYSSVPTIVVTRQAAGDLQYLFAVNATPDRSAKDEKGNPLGNALAAVEAKIGVSGIGTTYDAVTGGAVKIARDTSGPDTPDGGGGTVFRFGPGQMRVWALTERPIGGVKVATPVVTREMVREEMPIRLSIAAILLDDKGGVLSGSAPLRVQVIDPQGATRYDLCRATKHGQLALELPLAANEVLGTWQVVVRDLLANTEDRAKFVFSRIPHAQSLTGSTPRAVYAANDRDNAFRFARTHHDVTLVAVKSAFNQAAAERLTKALAPWGVRCRTMPVDEAAKSRRLSEDEARTWVGLPYAGSGHIKPGGGNSPSIAGFALSGPVILVGNPEDHPIIKFLLMEKFLPYTPDAAKFPGPGRGMLAWQRDGVGPGQESITLIAYDEAGMAEAVGSFYEAVAGIEPLTKWTLPNRSTIKLAHVPESVPELKAEWTATLPDRVTGISSDMKALTHDQSVTVLDGNGKAKSSESLSAADYQKLLTTIATKTDAAAISAAQKQCGPQRLVKFVVKHGERSAIAYWGGTLELRDAAGAVKTRNHLPQDVTALTSADKQLLVGLADGRVMALAP